MHNVISNTPAKTGTVHAGWKAAGALVATSLATIGNSAMAQTGTDFSGILDGLSTATMVTAVIAAAGLIAVVGFAVWGAKKLARFFG